MTTNKATARTRRSPAGPASRRGAARPGRRISRGRKSWIARKILVPLDFSESADHALGMALDLARKNRGKITLVHVVEPLIYPPDAGLVPLDQAQVVKASRRQLREWAERRLPAQHRGQVIVVMGHPAHEIARLAADRKSDLLIISTHGYTGLQHVLLGSTAERVVRLAPCPVLVLRQK